MCSTACAIVFAGEVWEVDVKYPPAPQQEDALWGESPGALSVDATPCLLLRLFDR